MCAHEFSTPPTPCCDTYFQRDTRTCATTQTRSKCVRPRELVRETTGGRDEMSKIRSSNVRTRKRNRQLRPTRVSMIKACDLLKCRFDGTATRQRYENIDPRPKSKERKIYKLISLRMRDETTTCILVILFKNHTRTWFRAVSITFVEIRS